MPVRITHADLREAMRDARYWKPGHPERAAFNAWVTDGFRALYPSDVAPRGAVWVKAYTRDGHSVAAHWRGVPFGNGGANDIEGRAPSGRGTTGYDAPEAVQANALGRLWDLLRRAPAGGRGPGAPPSGSRPNVQPGAQRRRMVDRDGRDRLEELIESPGTRRAGRVHSDRVEQFDRPGGEAGRQRDLESLRPIGAPRDRGNGRVQYDLEDGRMAVVRPATHARSNYEPTLEVFQPNPPSRDWTSVGVFRYPRGP